MTHLEYVQNEAAKNMAFHMENMDSLRSESNATLSFLFVFISAAFSASIKLYLESGFWPVKIALAVLCCYLTATAVYLVFACMLARDVQPPSNEPKNLELKDYYLSEEIQKLELENLQVRIDLNRERNERTAFHLNVVRIMICLSPVTFALVIFIVLVLMELCAASAA